jgi:branched-chain amino acid transport system ATP-binding protein
MNALELHGLHKRFGLTEVIRGTDLAVRDGERLALIGPNGAGKSTLFALVSGQLQPDAGRVILFGRDVTGQRPDRLARAGLGRSFQVSNAFGGLSVRDNLRVAVMGTGALALRPWARWRHDPLLAEGVASWLDRLELAHRADTPVAELSYAEQRLLEIGLTAAGGARCVLLDEPTSGMSRAETQRVIALVRSLSVGHSLVMIEHDMNVVFDLADRVAVLVYGQVIAIGTPAEVRADAAVRDAYLGRHQAQRVGHA